MKTSDHDTLFFGTILTGTIPEALASALVPLLRLPQHCAGMPVPKDFLTQKAAAREIGVSDRYFRDMIGDGTAPPGVLYGKRTYYRLGDIETWKANRSVTAKQYASNEAILSEFMTGIVWCVHHGQHIGAWVASVTGPGPVLRQVYYCLDRLGPSSGPAEMADAEERIGKALARATPGQIEEVRRIFRGVVPELRHEPELGISA